MFDLFRSRQKSVRILLGVLLGLVALSMLVYLIPGGPGSAGATGESVVAVVGDEKVTAQDVQRAIQRITSQQANIPRAFVAQYIPTLVNEIVNNKAMSYKARELGLSVSDKELAGLIQDEFSAQLGGQFDMNIYQMALNQQGMTVAQYEKERRDAYLALRLETLELSSLVVSEDEAKAEYQRKSLKVGLQYLAFEPKSFADKVKKDPAVLKAYFDKNRSLFQVPEKRDIQLIIGAVSDFSQSAKISDADLQKRYQENLESYRVPERVNVRHILIKTQGKPKEELPKLKAKAEDILKQLQKGADFAELAKKNSEDPGSGAKGGDLGWIIHNQTVPAFDKTAFSLKPKELSGLVETEYGYHIIQVMDKQAAHVQSFDDVKPQLLAEAQKDAGTANLKKAINDARAEIVRNPSQALDIAKKYDLKFFKLDKFSRTDAMPELNSQPEVSNAIFATPKGTVSNVTDLDSVGKSALGIVNNIYPSHKAEYAEVEKDVLQRYTDAESLRLSQEAAKTAAARAKKGESLEALAKEYGLSVKTAAPFPVDGAAEGIGAGSYLTAAFKANVGDVVGPVAAGSGQFVCKVSEKIPADMTQFAKEKDALIQQMGEQKRSLQQSLFRASVVADLKRRGKVKLNQDLIGRMVSSNLS